MLESLQMILESLQLKWNLFLYRKTKRNVLTSVKPFNFNYVVFIKVFKGNFHLQKLPKRFFFPSQSTKTVKAIRETNTKLNKVVMDIMTNVRIGTAARPTLITSPSTYPVKGHRDKPFSSETVKLYLRAISVNIPQTNQGDDRPLYTTA